MIRENPRFPYDRTEEHGDDLQRAGELARALSIPAITDALNPSGLALKGAFDLSLPTWQDRGARPELHLSSSPVPTPTP